MVIGVISDTHGFLHPEVAEVFSGVDAIFHAGDVGPVEVLQGLQEIAPVHAVYGNVDGPPVRKHLAPEWQDIEMEGTRIVMTHIGGHPKRWAPGVKARLAPDPPRLFICGHSHILRMERVPNLGNMLYLNPGAAGRQGFHQIKTCVRLHLEEGAVTSADVIHLT
ncbi:metallophosphoesterase [soil metagenome]